MLDIAQYRKPYKSIQFIAKYSVKSRTYIPALKTILYLKTWKSSDFFSGVQTSMVRWILFSSWLPFSAKRSRGDRGIRFWFCGSEYQDLIFSKELPKMGKSYEVVPDTSLWLVIWPWCEWSSPGFSWQFFITLKWILASLLDIWCSLPYFVTWADFFFLSFFSIDSYFSIKYDPEIIIFVQNMSVLSSL